MATGVRLGGIVSSAGAAEEAAAGPSAHSVCPTRPQPSLLAPVQPGGRPEPQTEDSEDHSNLPAKSRSFIIGVPCSDDPCYVPESPQSQSPSEP